MKLVFCCVASLLVFGPASQALAQECEACYRESASDPWICIYQNHGYTTCIGGSQCTRGAQCDSITGGGCFLAGTLVMVEGGELPIEHIEVGDFVLGKSRNGAHEYHMVTAVHKTIEHEFYALNGSLLVTAKHPFFVGGNWVAAEDLWVGAELLDVDGETLAVETIQTISKGVRVYNIEVDGHHTFFANRVLVHNKKPIPSG